MNNNDDSLFSTNSPINRAILNSDTKPKTIEDILNGTQSSPVQVRGEFTQAQMSGQPAPYGQQPYGVIFEKGKEYDFNLNSQHFRLRFFTFIPSNGRYIFTGISGLQSGQQYSVTIGNNKMNFILNSEVNENQNYFSKYTFENNGFAGGARRRRTRRRRRARRTRSNRRRR